MKDMELERSLDELKTVAFAVGLNHSDQTFGWNGYKKGLTMYYSHYTDTVVEEVHSIPITPGLTPVAFVQNNQKTYLGYPFTECIETTAHNRH